MLEDFVFNLSSMFTLSKPCWILVRLDSKRFLVVRFEVQGSLLPFIVPSLRFLCMSSLLFTWRLLILLSNLYSCEWFSWDYTFIFSTSSFSILVIWAIVFFFFFIYQWNENCRTNNIFDTGCKYSNRSGSSSHSQGIRPTISYSFSCLIS